MKQQRGDSQAPEAASAAQATLALVPARAPITDRVNAEPAIMNGMTGSEGTWIAALCLLTYVTLDGLLWALTGWWQTMIIIPLFGTAGTVWFVSLYLAKVKRGRPEGYYRQAIHVWVSGYGLTTCQFIRRSGYWSLGRVIPGLTSPLVFDAAPMHMPSGSRMSADSKTSQKTTVPQRSQS